MVCADTSFLFSLYGNDVHSATALVEVSRRKASLAVVYLGLLELENAIRFSVFRKAVAPSDGAASLAAIAADLTNGKLALTPVSLSAVVTRARAISATHTVTGGHRVFDILHIAVALQLSAKEFLSFDANQLRLARKAGLKTGP